MGKIWGWFLNYRGRFSAMSKSYSERPGRGKGDWFQFCCSDLLHALPSLDQNTGQEKSQPGKRRQFLLPFFAAWLRAECVDLAWILQTVLAFTHLSTCNYLHECSHLSPMGVVTGVKVLLRVWEWVLHGRVTSGIWLYLPGLITSIGVWNNLSSVLMLSRCSNNTQMQWLFLHWKQAFCLTLIT